MATSERRSNEPSIRDHQEWLGYLQPNGLVVSPQVLFDQQVIIDRSQLPELQRNLIAALAVPPGTDREPDREPRFGPFLEPQIDGTPDGFAIRFLGWHANQIEWKTRERQTIDPSLTVSIPELDATLSPTAALRSPPSTKSDTPKYQLLIEELAPDTDFDARYLASRLWETTPSARFERLLTETGVALGVLSNAKQLRLFYAPRGETAGHLTFHAKDMTGTAGRLIVGGLHELLKAFRLTNAPSKALLPALCETSRKYQSTVSAALAEQVLEALYELVRGFQSAHDATHGELLRPHLEGDDDARQGIYRGLLRTLMRSVFLLFAEDRDLLPAGELYHRNYSLHGLFDRLREDDGRYHDTMDSRYGAWSQLLALFRLIYRGSPHPSLSLPARHGYLFDPDAFPFLEGRTLASPKPPLVSDGCVYRVLEKLLLLKGERLSYRTLDVEQIGSVYETMMGFKMTVAAGASIAIKPKKKGGAPVGLDLDKVLAEKPTERAKLIEAEADTGPIKTHTKALKDADTHDAVVAALDSRVAHAATPRIVPKGALLLQPSDERRRSGSHYTPRSLTQPIVAKTLEPIFARLGPDARPDQILDLKICDPAMGSGAFLVEVCRQVGKRLEDAWTRHGAAPRVTAQDDLVTLARRMVAQRCVYGVDRNDMAVDLAKLSLWLATLAKDHPFTFLDHALRHGDSLVGLDLAQLEAFHWDASKPKTFVSVEIAGKLQDAIRIREEIRRADDSLFREEQLKKLLEQSEQATAAMKIAGDLVIAAFFGEEKDKDREALRLTHAAIAQAALKAGEPEVTARAARTARAAIARNDLIPFHWGIAFPEVFLRSNGGFDAFVGNPPFAGKNTLANSNCAAYPSWLQALHTESHGNADLVAHFFRRAFNLLRAQGAFGLIATNTIAQGDTRGSGLRWICTHGGEIFAATRRLRWPGEAAVVVSVVHVFRGKWAGLRELDRRSVDTITAFLFHAGGHDDPSQLAANGGKSFVGSYVLGMGFTFDDTDKKGVASSIAEMHRLIAADPCNTEVIFPYIGGEEINTSPTHAHHRYVINFGERSEAECRAQWPALMQIVEAKVKPERALLTKNAIGRKRAKYWWHYGSTAKKLYAAIAGLDRVLVISRVGQHAAMAFVPADMVVSDSMIAFATADSIAFTTLQSRPHETWARFFASSMKDDLRYTPSTCFETFPFPPDFESNPALEHTGRAYYDFRAALMVKNDEGLTKTYNRFHDPENHEPDIVRLRELHAAMDRAVLDAYGWTDIPTACDFFPDYVEEDDDGNEVPKSIRYRWPDEVRDEVLARLLALNAERHAEEVKLGLASPDGKRMKRGDDDDDDVGEDAEDSAPAKSKKAAAKKAPAAKGKGKKQLAKQDVGQLEFGGDD
jgi:hypothetical protein